MNRLRLFNAITVSMLAVALILVAVALATVNALDRRVIEAAAARNRHAEFLLAASVVNRRIERSDDLRNTKRMGVVLSDIQLLRPGIRELELIELTSGVENVVISTGEKAIANRLTDGEIGDLRANKILSYFESSGQERAWIFTAPITTNDTIVGALRGRFSVSKYDQLIDAQEQVAKQVAIGSIVLTSLTMLLLIRIQLHRPLSKFLNTMEQVGSGNILLEAPINGPLEIRRLAANFNQMMRRLHDTMKEKQNLLEQIHAWNEKLEARVTEALVELKQEKDNVAFAQLTAQRNSKLAALGEMSAIMAHELGNPLNTLYGRVQLINNMDMTEECRRHMKVIEAQIARMTDVMNHILRSTRIATEATPVHLNDVIIDVVELIQVAGVELVIDLAPQLPSIAVDKTSLHGLILNLVTNALQAMGTRGTLTISTRMVGKPEIEGHLLVQSLAVVQPMVRLQVMDSGPGIPVWLLDRICEPFYSTRQSEGGTGLGLAICRRVITSAGGQFAVKSSPSESTVFTVDFPVWEKEN